MISGNPQKCWGLMAYVNHNLTSYVSFKNVKLCKVMQSYAELCKILAGIIWWR